MTAEATRLLAEQPLPAQPAIVRDWIRARRHRTAEALWLIDVAVRSADPEAVGGRLYDAITATLGEPPADVAAAYREWAARYNAIAAARNAERQARINARAAAQARAASCPRCFTIHPGEC